VCKKNSNPSPEDATRLQNDDCDAVLLSKRTDTSVPWDLAKDKDGWPLLPLELALPLAQLKEILRSCFTIAYRKLFTIRYFIN
jgi:hypothetical protein